MPFRLAVVSGEESVTYRELLDCVDRLGSFLISVRTFNPGDRIILYMQNCLQFMISYFSVSAARGILVPVNPMLEPDELRYIITDSGAKIIIAGDELLDKVTEALSPLESNRLKILNAGISSASFKQIGGKVNKNGKKSFLSLNKKNFISWDTAMQPRPRVKFNKKKITSSDVFIIPYTSGTTGKSKGCKHSYRSLNAVILAYSAWFSLPEGAKILASLPFFHVTGMQNSMNVPIFRGDTIVLLGRWDVNLALKLIKKYKIQSWRSITTSIIDLISVFDPKIHDLSSLVSLGGGGAPMPKVTANKIKKILSLDYIEAYGMTETMAPTHINPPCRPKLGSIGIPIFNVDARIIDFSSKKQVTVGQIGELVISGPQVFLGYWGRSIKDKDVFINISNKEFLRTGDA